jgi:hypothetical protein
MTIFSTRHVIQPGKQNSRIKKPARQVIGQLR